jgi:hypothetical protein
MLVGMAMDARAMMQVFSAGDGVLALLAQSSAWLAMGALVGIFHFLTLRTSVRILTAGSSLLSGLALHLARFTITVGALALIVRHGALPLLAATLGIVASRTAVLRFGAPP